MGRRCYEKRPSREEFFLCFVTQLRGLRLAQPSVLESIPGVEYTMLDFSPAMHELARERLGSLAQAVHSASVEHAESFRG